MGYPMSPSPRNPSLGMNLNCTRLPGREKIDRGILGNRWGMGWSGLFREETATFRQPNYIPPAELRAAGPRLRTLADSVVRFNRSMSAAAFLFPPVLRSACSRMLRSITASVSS